MPFSLQSHPPFVRKDRNNEITIHVPPTRVKGAPPLPTSRMKPTHGGYQPTKFEQNPSIGLACTLGYNFFAKDFEGFRRKDGNGFGPIGCTWHVPQCDRANPCKKDVAQGAGLTNGQIRLKLCMSIAKSGGQLPSAYQRWCPLGTCQRHVPSDFINLLIAHEQLVRLGRKTHGSTGTEGGKITLSVTEG